MVFKQLCEAVRYLHERGIVNRDIKIDNILAVSDGKKAGRWLTFADALSLAAADGCDIKLADFSTVR